MGFPFQPFGRWLTRPIGGWNEADAVFVTAAFRPFTISGGGTTRIFVVDADDSLVNLGPFVLSGGHATSGGGAISVVSVGGLNVDETAFSGNSTTQVGGGAVYFAAVLGAARFSSCVFDSNTATATVGRARGGAVYLAADPSAAEPVVVELSGCTFTNSSAQHDGGAVAVMMVPSHGVRHHPP